MTLYGMHYLYYSFYFSIIHILTLHSSYRQGVMLNTKVLEVICSHTSSITYAYAFGCQFLHNEIQLTFTDRYMALPGK